jgi:hypothetical protein
MTKARVSLAPHPAPHRERGALDDDSEYCVAVDSD